MEVGLNDVMKLICISLDGRRPVYLWSLPVFVFGALGVSIATQIPSLLFFRFLQGLGAAPGLVLGPGVIGDIYKAEERGRAMSVFLSVSLFISRSFVFFPLFFFTNRYVHWDPL